MKKVALTLIALLACCIQAEAQKYLNIFQDGLVINKILASDVDSISVLDVEPYTINMWSKGSVLQSFASEEVDSITVIDENGGPLSYLGVIGFNSDLSPKNIGLLSTSTESQYESFVDQLSKKDGTILYYAVDSALYALEKADIKTPLKSINFVTFTDGLDVGSIMKNPNYSSSNNYLDAISRRIKDTRYKGLKMDAYAIGLRGKDVTDVDLFKRNLTSLASSDQNAFEVKSMAELESRLSKIANKINNTNYRQTISVKIVGVDNGTLVRLTFDGQDAENSQLYIQGTLDLSDYSLRNVTYHGIKTRSGSTIQGTKDDIFITFTFRGLRQGEGDAILPTENIKQYNCLPTSTNWQPTSELEPNIDTQCIVSYSGTLIILVLDCSSSLGDYDFRDMKKYAKKFINMVANNAMPFTFESPKNVKAAMDDNDFVVNVSWDAVKGADYYQVYRTNNSSSELVADNITSCSWTDISPQGSNISYKVCAVGYGLTSAMSSVSNSVSCSLSAPQNPICGMTTNGDQLAISISWDEVKYAEGYQVYRSNKSNGKYTLIADSINSYTYLDESPYSGYNYYYVKAIGHGLTSSNSTKASIENTLPAPKNVAGELILDDNKLAISVTWDAVTSRIAKADNNAKEYEWEVMITDDFDKSIPITKIRVLNKKTNISSYCCLAFSTVPNENIGTSRYYIGFGSGIIGDNMEHDLVRGFDISSNCTHVGNNWYEYEFSRPVYFAYYQENCPRGQVKALIKKNASEISDIDLTTGKLWAIVNLAEKYQVYRSNNSRGTFDLIADDITTNKWIDKSPLSGDNYYRVRAIGYGTSSDSETSAGISTSNIPAPKNVAAELTLNGDSYVINVTWDAVKIAEKYQVYRSNSSGYNAKYELVADDITTTSWTDDSPLSGSYYYKVRAIGHEMTSYDSNSSQGVNCSVNSPTNVAGELTLSDNNFVINVTWDAVEKANSYNVYRSDNYYGDYEKVAEGIATNSWTDNSPIVGYNYYKVQAVDHGLKSQQSDPSNGVNCALDIPQNVKGELTLNGNDLAISVTWDAVTYAESYEIWRSNDRRPSSFKKIVDNVTSNSWIDPNPFDGYNYYQVVAFGHALKSDKSSMSDGVSLDLSEPTNVTGKLSINNNKLVINVSWDAVSIAEKYIVFRSNSDWYGNFEQVADNVTSNSWTDENPLSGSNYYRIQAVGHGLTSQQSYTSSSVSYSISAPTNLKCQKTLSGGQQGVDISWNEVKVLEDYTAESYIVYRSSSYSGEFVKIAEGITSTSWRDESPLDGTNYYKVAAYGYGLTGQQSSYTSVQ